MSVRVRFAFRIDRSLLKSGGTDATYEETTLETRLESLKFVQMITAMIRAHCV